MADSKYKIDMTQGSIFRKLMIFVFPLILTYAMQSLFQAVDMMVVGRFCSHEALAAIGATGNPIALMLKIHIGLGTGVNAAVAMYFGAKNHMQFYRGTHTAMALALYGGFVLMGLSLAIVKPLLVLMKTPDNILADSCLYMRIIFLGIPFLMIFNFGCALLRAVGDSRRPMFYLMVSGVLNVLLNLLFVLVFRMAVAGVAIATTISNALAAGLILRTLTFSPDLSHIVWKKVRISWQTLKEILWIGIPAAVNSSFFNIANMFIQTAVNSFGSLAIAGCSAASTVESFVALISMAFQQAAMTFVAQNFGAKNYTRVVRSCVIGLAVSAGCSFLMGWGIFLLGEPILSMFNTEPQVIHWGMLKLRVMLTTLFMGCLMDISCGCLRGLGHSMVPAVASFLGACVFRVLWVVFVFPRHASLEALMMCYPVSWLLVMTFNFIMLYAILKQLFKKELGTSKLTMFP